MGNVIDRLTINDATMAHARKRVSSDWTDSQKQSRYLKKNIEIVLCYGRFQPGQDGYEALAMIQAFAETLTAAPMDEHDALGKTILPHIDDMQGFEKQVLSGEPFPDTEWVIADEERETSE